MPLQDGGRITMWSFDDRGEYAIADITTQTKTSNGYQTDFSHRCLIVDQAYQNLKGVDLPVKQEKDATNKKYSIAHIADSKYKRDLPNGSSYEQAPITIAKKWNRDANREEWTVKIWNAELVETKHDKANETPAPKKEPAPSQQETSSGGLVGLDFLNIPDANALNELPFK